MKAVTHWSPVQVSVDGIRCAWLRSKSCCPLVLLRPVPIATLVVKFVVGVRAAD